MDTFSGYHPLINFTYFVIVIGLSMFYMHPVFLALSLIGSVSYSIYLKGRKTVKVFLLGMLLPSSPGTHLLEEVRGFPSRWSVHFS